MVYTPLPVQSVVTLVAKWRQTDFPEDNERYKYGRMCEGDGVRVMV